jgi:hypothetical protein
MLESALVGRGSTHVAGRIGLQRIELLVHRGRHGSCESGTQPETWSIQAPRLLGSELRYPGRGEGSLAESQLYGMVFLVLRDEIGDTGWGIGG